ncbi:MAG: hypothetical protein E6H05_08110 [Bacillati bacterium ANGP1]|uniref:Uncharacterized protein n=1 Tax=Candidatus Segetimicrobium genomatis TaxID=2569760 RepID=A0A537ITC0_9BACT|nr:MAG: hypothetical protein E6H05_08110 [Terrabacteria group bacterium ANGP1]
MLRGTGRHMSRWGIAVAIVVASVVIAVAFRYEFALSTDVLLVLDRWTGCVRAVAGDPAKFSKRVCP